NIMVSIRQYYGLSHSIAAINTFHHEHGLVPLAVCSCTAAYHALADKFHLHGAVVVQPLLLDQINQYLSQKKQNLGGLQTALEADRELRELAKTPLMLSIMSQTYQGTQATVFDFSESSKERRQRLFDAYVDTMFRRRHREAEYTQAQTRRWLTWL